ncbi:hypothetical protein GCM10009642_06570 [Nocardiopsis metallicus]
MPGQAEQAEHKGTREEACRGPGERITPELPGVWGRGVRLNTAPCPASALRMPRTPGVALTLRTAHPIRSSIRLRPRFPLRPRADALRA